MDLAMFGAGGLMGIRAGVSMMIGMILNFFVIVPWMITIGEILPRPDGSFSRIHVLNTWALWWGIAIMVTAALASLFAKPKILVSAFSGFFKKTQDQGGTWWATSSFRSGSRSSAFRSSARSESG